MEPIIVNAVAPTRICDIGGWTDTWFAGHGSVFSIAVYPHVEVQIFLTESPGRRDVTIDFENYGERLTVDPDDLRYDQHPLIHAALDVCGVPENVEARVNIFCAVPPGASTGTSAAVSVALVAALSRVKGGRLAAHEIAHMAHRLETEKLELQSGVQDQMASAYGGINYMQITQYPHTTVSQLHVPDATWWELENRLSLLYVGQPHSSSEIHHQVIKSLGESAGEDARIVRLRELAEVAKSAILAGEIPTLAGAMNENTEVQRSMHSGLVPAAFEDAIERAEKLGGVGFKVNGAGGDGGTLTILSDGDMAKKRRMQVELESMGYSLIPLYLARRGVRSWISEGQVTNQ